MTAKLNGALPSQPHQSAKRDTLAKISNPDAPLALGNRPRAHTTEKMYQKLMKDGDRAAVYMPNYAIRVKTARRDKYKQLLEQTAQNLTYKEQRDGAQKPADLVAVHNQDKRHVVFSEEYDAS